ncbi:MAG TPA: tetratricopeptide repeat protein [Blastocatellia bacterium]|nr:tetratricopeptide repeat protein [Blastocatellia bacterium]
MMKVGLLPSMRVWCLTIFVALSLFVTSQSMAQTRRDSAQQDAAAAFEEGQNAQERGDLQSAVKFYTTAISAEPSLFQAYYQRAVAYIALGRESDAETDLKKVIELQPDFARAHRALGQILLDRGLTDEAKRALARAVELEPKLPGARINLASALIKSNDPAAAIEHLRVAIAQGESPALAHALLGVAEERLKKTEEAFADYSRAIELEPNLAAAREGRARLLESRGEFAKAIEDYSIAYRAQPSPDTALRLAHLHARVGQPQAAIQIYRSLLREKPNNIPMRIEVARLLVEIGQAEEAGREVEKLLALQPQNADLLILAGDVRFKDSPEQAADYYRRALAAQPDNNRVRVQLAASLVRSMQFAAALPLLNEAIAREPNNYPAHANLATALFKLEQYPQAAREFIWLIRAKPEIAASYYFLAISFDKIGDCGQAYRAYQEFARRADPAANKKELEDANIRLGLLQRLVKENKCKSPSKGKSK